MSQTIQLKTLQSVLFLAIFDLTDKLKTAASLNDALGGIFNGNPTILPIPDDAPYELPRIILNSLDGAYICNISPKRVDLILNLHVLDEADLKQITKDFIAKTSVALDAVHSAKGVVDRYALVSAFDIHSASDPIELLKKNVVDKIGKDAKDMQLHALYEAEVDGLKSNHWVRMLSQNVGKEEASLSVLSDVNTVEDLRSEVRVLDSTNFYSHALIIAQEKVTELFGG